jgi:transcriptional regulator with XRE-family HTH domain
MTTRWFDRANALLKTKGLTRVEVGKALGLTPQAASLKLSGQRPTSVGEIEVIAGIAGVSAAELIMGDAEYILSLDEMDTIRLYRLLSPEQKVSFKSMLQAAVNLLPVIHDSKLT